MCVCVCVCVSVCLCIINTRYVKRKDGTVLCCGLLTCQWKHQTDNTADVQRPYLLHHETSFFCSSLIKNESTWLHSKRLHVVAIKDFCGIIIYRTTTRSLQNLRKCSHFFAFSAIRTTCVHASVPTLDSPGFFVEETLMTDTGRH